MSANLLFGVQKRDVVLPSVAGLDLQSVELSDTLRSFLPCMHASLRE